MFENLLFQNDVKKYLLNNIASRSLPQVIHFTGQRHSGKMTAALESIRAMTCRSEDAAWKCSCNSCIQQRSLSSPHTIFMGRRYFSNEIFGASASPKLQSPPRILLERNIKKLTRRFDGLLWEHNKPEHKKAISLIEQIWDNFEKGTTKANETIMEIIPKLENILPAQGLNIDMIRNMSYWAHTADRSQLKFIIIEGMEYLNIPSANALLKILEEPPSQTYFFCISENQERIIPTLRSRMQTLHFQRRNPEEQQKILGRVYRVESEFPSIQAYFDSCEGAKHQNKNVELMLRMIEEQDISLCYRLGESLNRDRRKLKLVIMNCLEYLKSMDSNKLDNIRAQRKLEEMQYRIEEFNIPVHSALEYGLY